MRGLPFTLTSAFLLSVAPLHCPILGIPLDYTGGKIGKGSTCASPTVDRIIGDRGYVENNVHVISMKANSIKQDATPEEILAVGDYYQRLLRSIDHGSTDG